MFLSKNPKLAMERMLVFGALGIYLLSHIKLQKQGQLAGEPDLLLKINKKKLFDSASKLFKMTPTQRTALEGLYEHFMEEEEK